jgi:antitoxin component of MazEF toxin-antitoxin module
MVLVKLHRLGKSKAVIIPASIIRLFEIEGAVEMKLTVKWGRHGRYIKIEPTRD